MVSGRSWISGSDSPGMLGRHCRGLVRKVHCADDLEVPETCQACHLQSVRDQFGKLRKSSLHEIIDSSSFVLIFPFLVDAQLFVFNLQRAKVILRLISFESSLQFCDVSMNLFDFIVFFHFGHQNVRHS
jgi:hypothetical protein